MEIKNTDYNIKSSFGMAKENNKKLTNEEKMNILIPKCMEVLDNIAEREVPENGKFIRVYVNFDIPGTPNEGILAITHDDKNPKDMRVLSLGVHHKNSDRMISNFLKTGTKKEISDLLKDRDNFSRLIEMTNHLSDRTDDYYSSL